MPFHVVTSPTIAEEVAVVRNTKQDQQDTIETTIDGAIDRCTEATLVAQCARFREPGETKRKGVPGRTLSPAEHADLVQLVTSSLASLSVIRRMLIQ
ncbi:hypothetical protein DIE03_20065 [Burkholderia sp. Bp8992]|nr:hypothetical protein DIE03_20065 [Burkholderia sp. Bp8992]